MFYRLFHLQLPDLWYLYLHPSFQTEGGILVQLPLKGPDTQKVFRSRTQNSFEGVCCASLHLEYINIFVTVIQGPSVSSDLSLSPLVWHPRSHVKVLIMNTNACLWRIGKQNFKLEFKVHKLLSKFVNYCQHEETFRD